MTVFANILVFQPAAIGDVMLATPVLKVLKENYPGAKITFWGHALLRDLLLGLCPYIDEYINYDKPGIISMIKTLWSTKCDLFVDLSNSTRGMIIAAFAPGNLHITAYKKQSPSAPEKMHAVQNFLQTVSHICSDISDRPFPTIFPEALADEVAKDILGTNKDKILIGIVPGVGKQRPHRSWLLDNWKYLLDYLLERKDCVPVLIGGQDEEELAASLEMDKADKVLNLVGKLSLPETAAVLDRCKVVISGDTGPAHIAVAVGTPVIGLYGATSPQRSGPYGFGHLVLDQSQHCNCPGLKSCTYSNPGESGQCMSRIMLTEVIDKVQEIIGEPECAEGNVVFPEI